MPRVSGLGHASRFMVHLATWGYMFQPGVGRGSFATPLGTAVFVFFKG